MNWLAKIKHVTASFIKKTSTLFIKIWSLFLRKSNLSQRSMTLIRKPFDWFQISNYKNYRFESLRKPHINGLIWVFMSAILISKVIHSQITNRQEWIIKGIIECAEFNQSDSQFVRNLSASQQKAIWNKNSNPTHKNQLARTLPKSPEDTFFLNHPLLITKNSTSHTISTQIMHIDLNHCDSIELESLPRIGPLTASKIIRYRERLGGYVSPFQLLEIYRIDSQILNIPNVQFHTNNHQKYISKIPSSGLTIKDLYRHPYIGKSKAQWLWKYIQAHPKLRLEEFKNSSFLSMEEKLRLIPYLKFE
jgi:DNA uptake protein ComE-like DNA-binding protein